MKKKSRFLTGLLSAVMALSLCALPVAAEGTTTSTIDTAKKGSLTIEKYEGENLTKPLAGVEFTIYKVADIEQVKDDAGNVSVSYKSLVSGVQIDASTKYDDIKDKISTSAITSAGKKKTVLNAEGNKASAKFNNLELGVYLVEESDAPSQVVTRSANFLVSIPMTNETRDGWTYDVVAQPKNATVYGGVHLVKTGTTLKADGSKPNIALANVEFALQAWDETTGWTTMAGKDSLKTNAAGKIDIEGLAPGKYRFVELEAVDGYIADGTATYEFEVKADEPDATITINVDNEKPDLDKTVKNGDNYATDADYSVGDMVEWKVSATVPSNVDKLKTFKITDKMSAQLTWVEDDANITVATDKDTDSAKILSTGDYTLTKPDNNTEGGMWTIEFTAEGKKKLKDNNVSRIDVTFKTKLNESANIGKDGNLNDAQLDYSNAIYPTTDEQPDNPNGGKEPKTDVIKDQAIIYTFLLDAVKVDGSHTDAKLPGAEFDLYRYNGDKENPTEAELKDTAKSEKVGHYISDSNGKLNITGLKKATYYLVETKAPTYKDSDGKDHSYNLLKEPVKVEISPAYSTKTTTTTTTDVNGITTTKTEVVNEKMENVGTNGTFTVTIKNNKGFNLPVTGGFGTLLFSAIGALLVVGGVGVLMSTKKKKGNA